MSQCALRILNDPYKSAVKNICMPLMHSRNTKTKKKVVSHRHIPIVIESNSTNNKITLLYDTVEMGIEPITSFLHIKLSYCMLNC